MDTVLLLTLTHLYHVHTGRMLLQHGRQQVLDHQRAAEEDHLQHLSQALHWQGSTAA